jgi:hypothetical protein
MTEDEIKDIKKDFERIKKELHSLQNGRNVHRIGNFIFGYAGYIELLLLALDKNNQKKISSALANIEIYKKEGEAMAALYRAEKGRA